MKAKHQKLTEERRIRTRVQAEVQRTTMHCGYLFYLIVALGAELSAGGVLPIDTTDPDMQSIIEDLQAALEEYSSVLNETSSLRDLPALPCTDAPAHLEQNSVAALAVRLSDYQVCAQQLQSFSSDVRTLCRVVTLNKDLLQYLRGSNQDSARCPSSTSPPTDFNSIRKSIQCVRCWSQQVAALRR